MLPGVTERELSGIFRPAEFRSLGFPIDQIQSLRTERHKFTLHIVANVINKSLTTVHNALKRLRVLKEVTGPESGNAANSSGPNSRLTCSEELNVTGWIKARQRKYDCPLPPKVRDSAGRLLLQ
jgi:hypothetical protein